MTTPLHIRVETPVRETARVAQVRGMFDLPPADRSAVAWEVCLPLGERPWNVGLIVGPSGCGKTTIARHLWPDAADIPAGFTWGRDRSILDDFPRGLPTRDIVALLSAVGFASPPAWLRPFRVLSTGEQFRATLARLLATGAPPGSPLVCDEFTSAVGRTAAQVASAALAGAVRRRGLQFVAVTCHDDVGDWLRPDWEYRPPGDFQWRGLRPRPPIGLEVFRCTAAAWPLFAPHHYLSAALAPAAVCLLAAWHDAPVAFTAWLRHLGTGPPRMREHRTVVLPDYQGVGIGHGVATLAASLWRGLGYRVTSTTSHPAVIAARSRSPLWRLHRPPSLAGRREDARGRAGGRGTAHATDRLTAGFTYVGPPLSAAVARRLLEARHGQVRAPAHPRVHRGAV